MCTAGWLATLRWNIGANVRLAIAGNDSVLTPFRVSAWARRPPMWPMSTWPRAWRSAWRTAATSQTRATPTSVPRTASAATTGARTHVSVTQVGLSLPDASFRLLPSITHHILFPLSRLFRQGMCGRLPAQPLWARFLLRSETQFVPRLHLRVWPELLRPVLRKQVRFICLWMDPSCRSTLTFLLSLWAAHDSLMAAACDFIDAISW